NTKISWNFYFFKESLNRFEKINLSKQKNDSIVVRDETGEEYEIGLTSEQTGIEVYALDKGISSSPSDTIGNGKFTEKDIEFQRKLIDELKKRHQGKTESKPFHK
ncbi:hypothetical protein, partial [Capnocytophaga sp.]|uniref:hypothetical protein n=1 Tax=Capnocytophaga sp. TaxID=44737 RepID=UPI0026DCD410